MIRKSLYIIALRNPSFKNICKTGICVFEIVVCETGFYCNIFRNSVYLSNQDSTERIYMENSQEQQNKSALSLFNPSGAAEEFPVLKAFQEYIEAEQAKARKRVVQICITFTFIFLIAVGGFMVAWSHAMLKNEALSERLINMAMNSHNNHPQNVAVGAVDQRIAAEDAALKQEQARNRELQEKHANDIWNEREKMFEMKQKHYEELALQREKARAEQDAAVAAERERLLKEYEKRLQSALSESKKNDTADTARKNAEAAAEKRRQEEERRKELYLRKQYPEYYAKLDAGKTTTMPLAIEPQKPQINTGRPAIRNTSAAPSKQPARPAVKRPSASRPPATPPPSSRPATAAPAGKTPAAKPPAVKQAPTDDDAAILDSVPEPLRIRPSGVRNSGIPDNSVDYIMPVDSSNGGMPWHLAIPK